MKTACVLSWIVLAASLVFPTGVVPAAGPASRFALDNGDVNGDGARNLNDAVGLLSFALGGGAHPVPLALCEGNKPTVRNGDIDGNGRIDVTDAVRFIAWLFFHGRPPVPTCTPEENDFRVVGPNVIPYGHSYGEWATRWWQWAFSLPVDQNPFFDETGALIDAGQSGPVWFLTGVINVSGKADRSGMVPAGKSLFFPILNFEGDNLCPPVDPPLKADQIRGIIKGYMDGAVDVSCEVDGKLVKDIGSYRVTGPVFTVTFPENNVFQSFGCGVPAGSYTPFVNDGVYVMLAPLSAGEHSVHFHGRLPDFDDFTLDITYHLLIQG